MSASPRCSESGREPNRAPYSNEKTGRRLRATIKVDDYQALQPRLSVPHTLPAPCSGSVLGDVAHHPPSLWLHDFMSPWLRVDDSGRRERL